MKGKVTLALVMFLMAGNLLFAQSGVKIGYTNVDYIISLLPETKQIESEIKAFEKQLTTNLQAKYQEYQTKAEAFQRGAASMSEVVRADKMEELQNLQANIEKFQREADSSLQKKQMDLFKPAYEKVQTAIETVAKANGFTHVLSTDAGGYSVLLYASDEDDISDLVLKSLGVTPPQD